MANSTATKSTLVEPTSDSPGRAGSAASAVSDVAGAVRDAAGDAASRLPEMAATTRLAFKDTERRIQAGSDEMLTIGTALSFGFGVGLLLGGASRILVAAAMVPVAMMGLTLLDRASQARIDRR